MPFIKTNMSKTQLIIGASILYLLGACSSDQEQSKDEVSAELTVQLDDTSRSVNQPVKQTQNDIIEYEKENTTKTPKVVKNPEKRFKEKEALSPQAKLVQSLDKNASISFASPDYAITRDDTLIKTEKDVFEIEYITSCLNDSLVPQEMYDYGRSNKKSYLISHNYRTNILVKVNGRATGKREIQKALFANQVDKEFLQKSIIKHPQFVRFDEATNEAVFEFMIGVPNTDWLVIAGVNLNSNGTLRIIDIIAPEL